MNKLFKCLGKGILLILLVLFVILLSCCLFKEVYSKANVDTQVKNDVEIQSEETISVHFIDVGQGDSTLIETEDGKFVLIDAGTNDCEFDFLSYLDKQNVEYIEYMFLTHQHEDHIGSADAVLDSYYVRNVVKTDIDDDCINCDNLEKSLSDSIKHIDTKVYYPKNGDVYSVDDIDFTVLSDGTAYDDLNDTSICIRMEYGESTFVFTGDAGKMVENDILKSGVDVSADVYKCGHHGSSTSNSNRFLDEINPDIAIISCAEGNSYGHPHIEVMDSLNKRNVEVYRTDVSGDIVFSCTKNKISLMSQP